MKKVSPDCSCYFFDVPAQLPENKIPFADGETGPKLRAKLGLEPSEVSNKKMQPALLPFCSSLKGPFSLLSLVFSSKRGDIKRRQRGEGKGGERTHGERKRQHGILWDRALF